MSCYVSTCFLLLTIFFSLYFFFCPAAYLPFCVVLILPSSIIFFLPAPSHHTPAFAPPFLSAPFCLGPVELLYHRATSLPPRCSIALAPHRICLTPGDIAALESNERWVLDGRVLVLGAAAALLVFVGMALVVSWCHGIGWNSPATTSTRTFSAHLWWPASTPPHRSVARWAKG